VTENLLHDTWLSPEDSYMLAADAIQDHIRHLKAIGRAESTRECARRSLTRWDRLLPMGILVALPEEIEGLLAADMPAGTRATYHDTLVRFYRWLVRTERIDYDPTADMGRPTVPRQIKRPPSDDVVAAACERGRAPWRLHYRLAAFAGLRCVEIARLDRADVTEHDGTLLRGKGGKQRIVPTPPEVWEMVEPMGPGPVTHKLDGGAATAGWVSDSSNDHLHVLGLQGATMHGLRRWFATTALAAGVNLRVVQELMGHASVATTEVYTYVFGDAMAAAVARMPRLTALTR
jgi:integrase/recombinase XerC